MRSTLSVYSDAVRRLHLQPAINSARALRVYGFPLRLASIIAKPDTQFSSHSLAPRCSLLPTLSYSALNIVAATCSHGVSLPQSHSLFFKLLLNESERSSSHTYANVKTHSRFAFFFYFSAVRRAPDHSHSIPDKRNSIYTRFEDG